MEPPTTETPVRLRISATSGRVTVIAEPRADVVVDRGGSAEASADGAIEIRAGRSSSVVVRCPPDADVIVGTRSGRIELRGRFGARRSHFAEWLDPRRRDGERRPADGLRDRRARGVRWALSGLDHERTDHGGGDR